ncbi:MAG: ATP-binding cassette domain-containing protein, partial [Candidatus Thorarchaeota archaeon]
MSKTGIVSVTGLSKTFGKVEALKEFTLDIEPGIFGLIGPNGAGKTTLIRVLLGLIHADAGQANVLGMDVRTHSL